MMLLGAGAGALGGAIVSASHKANLQYDAPLNQPDMSAVKRIVARVGVGERIRVTAASTQETTGTIQAIGEDEFSIVPQGQTAPLQIAYGDVRAVRAIQGVGTKVGIAAGVIGGVGVVLMCLQYCGGN